MTIIGTVDVDPDVLNSFIAEYLSDNGFIDHSGVVDTIEEHVKDNLDIDGAIEQVLGDGNYQTERDVQALIDNMGFVTDSDVKEMIRDEALDVVDEEDVERIVHDVLAQTENKDVADLERRFDQYAKRVDDIRQSLEERGAQGYDDLAKRIESLERRMDAFQGNLHNHAQDHDVVTAMHQRIEALEAHNEVLTARLGDNNVMNAITLMDLLRRAAVILGIARA